VNKETEPLWDAFISHAREDKARVVQPLFEELQRRNYRIWYDVYELKLGDSLRESIERGLTRSRYGIVVLSKAFLQKRWPKSELDGLVARESSGRKVILPIWHEVTEEEVLARSPLLAGRLAIDSREGTQALADAIAEVLGAPVGASAVQAIESLTADGSRADLEGMARNVLIEGASPVAAAAAENKLSEIIDALKAEPEIRGPAPAPAVPAAEPRAASRFDVFVSRGQSGSAEDVEFLMRALTTDREIGTSKLVDYALGLVDTHPGRRRIERFLFEGDQAQRNFAALYFKRQGEFELLRRAVAEKKIDSVQAFSR
jgi:hypothetical protein